MSTSVLEREGRTVGVTFEKEGFVVQLTDGRRIFVPFGWYPRLQHATRMEREGYVLIGRGQGIHWPDLDEDISVEGLLAGRPSQEGGPSLRAWLATRKRPARVAEPKAPYRTKKKSR